MRKLLAAVPLVLLVALLAACGSTSNAASTGSSTASTSTTTACPTVSVGTIRDASSKGLVVTNLQGKQVQIAFTSATKFNRTAAVTSSALQTGLSVSVTVMQNANNTYSALSISVRSSQLRQGGFTRGSSQCRSQFPRRNGTPGTPGAFGSGQGRQVVNGTISQISGNQLTLSNPNGDDFIVSLTATTRITSQLTATAHDLKSGEAVTITGTPNGQGVISASNVSILQSLPNALPTTIPNA